MYNLRVLSRRGFRRMASAIRGGVPKAKTQKEVRRGFVHSGGLSGLFIDL
jgi:hypothetical protein